MNPHCKKYMYRHSAQHPKGSPLYRSKYEDWCAMFGATVSKMIGHCKLNNAKKEKETKT